MKLSIAAITLTTLYTQASAAPATSGAPQPASVPTCGYPTVPLLRAWSQAQTDHLYTTNTTEMNTFLANGYTDQGIAAYILPSDTQAPTAVPLFRLYNPRSTDHYLTANAFDRDRVVSRNGCVSQGVVGFVYAHGECETVSLRRLFGQHSNFFTATRRRPTTMWSSSGTRTWESRRT